jgi:programmed cell death protein 5
MDEAELDDIRRRKLEEIQRAAEQQLAERDVAAKAAQQRQAILRQILTPEARERLGRVALAYPEIAADVENRLIALAQSGRLQRPVDDPTLRDILRAVVPKKRDIKIEWR